MVNRVCILLEALSIVVCIHHLYGEKFKLDIKTVSLLGLDMIMMTSIDFFDLPSTLSILIYPLIAVYCGLKFDFKWKAIIINNVLYMAIISGIQVLIMLICFYAFHINRFGSWALLFINVVILCIVCLIPRKKLHEVSKYLQDKEKILILSLGVSVIVTFFCLFDFKNINKKVELEQTILLFICILFIIFLGFRLSKYRIKAKEIETELKMHKLYAESFQGLIENIRLRQHEFDNHINTIYSQHFLYNTLDELVQVQKKYCEVLLRENRYNKLLSNGNSIIIGFLYGKFIEIDKKNIDIIYKISIKELQIGIPVYKMVEILGDLLNNAVEALELEENKKLYISIIEKEGKIEAEVRNISKRISIEEIHNFFDKGYSKKGINRGLGLYNVKKVCEEYNFIIECQNKEIENENWLSFLIKNNVK